MTSTSQIRLRFKCGCAFEDVQSSMRKDYKSEVT